MTRTKLWSMRAFALIVCLVAGGMQAGAVCLEAIKVKLSTGPYGCTYSTEYCPGPGGAGYFSKSGTLLTGGCGKGTCIRESAGIVNVNYDHPGMFEYFIEDDVKFHVEYKKKRKIRFKISDEPEMYLTAQTFKYDLGEKIIVGYEIEDDEDIELVDEDDVVEKVGEHLYKWTPEEGPYALILARIVPAAAK